MPVLYKTLLLALISLSPCVNAAGSVRPHLLFYQLAPIQSDTYVTSPQIQVMRRAFELARKDYLDKFPGCRFELDEKLSISQEEDLYRLIRENAGKAGRKAIIGITRSNFARLAAKAAQGSDMRGISSAAFTDELAALNKNFISVSNSWRRQWEVSHYFLRASGCDETNTLGIFSATDVLGRYYRTAFMSGGYLRHIRPDELGGYPGLSEIKCLYMGTSLPASIAPLASLVKSGWKGQVVGMGDWTFYTPEMRAFLKGASKRRFSIHAPLVWKRTENPRVQKWVEEHFGSEEVEPLSICVYDSAVLAMNYLCRGKEPGHFDPEDWKRIGLLRDYSGISETGNLRSELFFVEIK